RCAGNVKILYFGDWVKVCGYLWDMQDAQVVCREIGCGSPLGVTHYFPSDDSYSYMMTEVNCTGSEDYLWECPYDFSDCYHGDASVICSGTCLPAAAPTSPCPISTAGLTKGFVSLQELLLQLTGGPNRCAGNVKILYFGDWVKVCGYLWDMQDAQVVCREIGCG
ncbi:DMBT1 protein, partial [Nyctiprogne leucopyga]|nr:DMBT1 protein [Nyctiprogne leucopyga]